MVAPPTPLHAPDGDTSPAEPATYGLRRRSPSVSIVDQTIGHARLALAQALAGSVLVVAGLSAERWWLSEAHERAADRHVWAEHIAGELRLADQRLTATAQLAVVSGQRAWIDLYDHHLSGLERALDEARQLAPPTVASRFDAQTRVAITELADMREAAFEALTVGEAASARAIFQGERYSRHEALLVEAIAEFSEAMVADTQASRDDLRRRSLHVGLAVLLGAGLLGAALWRGLSTRLTRTRRHFLDAEARMQRLASRDLLTGLANRTGLYDAMAASLARAERDGGGLAVLMLDLDRFKAVNDRHGHTVGDQVLKEVARRLRRAVRGGELRSRFGGDQFVVVVEEHGDPQAARAVAERLVQSLGAPMRIGDLQLLVGASVGVARYPTDAQDADELLRRADSALYRAKTAGRGQVCFYDRTADERVSERALVEQELREGIAAGDFVPYYQPIVGLGDGRVRGAEMLCRWRHPRRGLLPPMAFIGVAEDAGLIDDLLMSVLRQACADLRRWPPDWRLSVNLAPQQMLDATVVPRLLDILREHAVAPERLDVELTETALVHDTARACEVMKAMKDAGLTVTLDDFGTGYSSLSYLSEMAFDKIKIDRSFVQSLRVRSQSAKVVEAVIGLSRSLGVDTVAEGVESELDAQALRQLGCPLAQGYWFGRPVPGPDLLLLHDRVPEAAAGAAPDDPPITTPTWGRVSP